MGRQVHGSVGERLTWVDADLRDPNWSHPLAVSQVDAVLSTTALHWLPCDALARLYHQIGSLVREGGVFLNGDTFRFGPRQPTCRRLGDALERQTRDTSHGFQGIQDWEGWWGALEAEPTLADLFAERRRRFAWQTREPGKRFSSRPSDGTSAPIIDFHEAALLNAGFREVGVIWQHAENRVLMAVR
jgi:hypothetical protein